MADLCARAALSGSAPKGRLPSPGLAVLMFSLEQRRDSRDGMFVLTSTFIPFGGLSMKPISLNTALGIAIFAVGVVLIAMGYRASGAPIDQISDALTGRYTDRTMWYIIGGVA